jgi:hypothetical protein
MRLEGIEVGDIVEVDRLGRRFHALVTGDAPGGLAIQPVDRKVSYGRPRTTADPLKPEVLQLELDLTRRD